MADKQVGSVNINVSGGRSENSNISTDKVMKDMLKEIKGLSGILTKHGKLEMSGLSSVRSSLGILTKLLGAGGILSKLLGAGGSLAALITGIIPLFKGDQPGINVRYGTTGSLPGENYYEKVQLEGDDHIVEIKKTVDGQEKINRILTMDEARQEGITNKKNRILEELTVENSLFDNITKNLASSRDAVIINTENLSDITASTEAEKILMQDIVRLQEQKRKELAAQVEAKLQLSAFGTATSRYQSQSGGAGWSDLTAQQSITTDEAKRRLTDMSWMAYGNLYGSTTKQAQANVESLMTPITPATTQWGDLPMSIIR
jgi:hypothetical protein